MSDESSARADAPSEYELAAFLAKTMVFHAVLLVVLAYVLPGLIKAKIGMTVPLAYGGAIAFLVMAVVLAVHAAGIRKSGGLVDREQADEESHPA